MNKLISGTLLFVLFWSVLMGALSTSDDELLALAPSPLPRAVASLPQPSIAVEPAVLQVAPVQLPFPMLRSHSAVVGESTGDAPSRYDRKVRGIEAPGAFPLSEEHWRDALPEEAGLEEVAAYDLMPVQPEPPDNPWGGEWGDQGGGG